MQAPDEPKQTSIAGLTDWAQSCLRQAGIEAPRREARLLLAHALRVEPADLLASNVIHPPQFPEVALFIEQVRRRCQREPLAYITGRQGFWTLDLEVSRDSLIPRADSEALIECLGLLRPDHDQELRMLDLGTGTGCLLLAALSEYPRGWGVGIDRDAGACALARRNAVFNGLGQRAGFVCASWSDPLRTEGGGYDLVLSNPPYVRSAEMGGLMPEVARFEPALALDGGPDGLAAYRAILRRLPGLLAADGLAILELGAGQADEVMRYATVCQLVPGPVHADLGGVARALAVRRG